MVILRRILFYIFLSAYLILCPLIVLYALGYIFTPKAEEGFAKTGLIHFETVPEGASLLIANKPSAEKTPATIRNLLAGQYDVKVVYPGFRPWECKVVIEPGKAIAFDKILLVPERLETKTLIGESFAGLLSIPDTRFLILSKTQQLKDLTIFDWKNETMRPFLPPSSSLANEEYETVFVSKGSPFLLLKMKGPKRRFFWCELEKEKPSIQDITGLFQYGEPSDVQWEGENPQYLFARINENIHRLEIEKMTVTLNFLEKIQGFGVRRGKVYALRADALIRKDFDAKKGDGMTLDEGTFLHDLFYGKGPFRIDFLSRDILCFLSWEGAFFFNEPPYRFVEKDLRGYYADASGKRIVFWQDSQLGKLDFSEPVRRKGLFRRGPEIEWVFQKGTAIRQAYFVYGDSHAVFLDKDQVFLISLTEKAKIHLNPLVKVLPNTAIFYAERTGQFYYLEPSQGYLTAVEILRPEARPLDYVINEIEKETVGVTR